MFIYTVKDIVAITLIVLLIVSGTIGITIDTIRGWKKRRKKRTEKQ